MPSSSPSLILIVAATSGDTSAPSAPMATVGSPMPVTPLTRPATKNVAATIRISDGEEAGMGTLVARRASPGKQGAIDASP